MKVIDIGGKKVKIQLWDTAGQERFQTITQAYYKGASLILLIYDVTDRRSFDDIQNWMQQIDNHARKDVFKVLVANKIDMAEHREVSEKEGIDLSKQYKVPYFETSAKTGENIDQMFNFCIMELLKDHLPVLPPRESLSLKLEDEAVERKKKTRICKWLNFEF